MMKNDWNLMVYMYTTPVGIVGTPALSLSVGHIIRGDSDL